VRFSLAKPTLRPNPRVQSDRLAAHKIAAFLRFGTCASRKSVALAKAARRRLARNPLERSFILSLQSDSTIDELRCFLSHKRSFL